jgi:hypothetical protein
MAGASLRVVRTWKDGTESIEEYAKSTGNLTTRKWRTLNTLGRSSKWEYEIGEESLRRRDGGVLIVSSRNVRLLFFFRLALENNKTNLPRVRAA